MAYYTDIIDTLYNGSSYNVLSQINASVYNQNLNSAETFGMHTGFTVKIHTGTVMEFIIGKRTLIPI